MKKQTVVSTASLLVTLAIAADRASAQPIVPVSQGRMISGSAFAEDLNGSDSESDSDQALDFGPFESGVSADAEVKGALGTGGSSQNSTINPDTIVAFGSAFATAESFDSDAFAEGSGLSRMLVEFDVSQNVTYQFRGEIVAYDFGGTQVTLSGSSGTIYSEFVSGPDGELTLEGEGSLSPGRYTLRIEASGGAFGDSFNSEFAFAEYQVTFGLDPVGDVCNGRERIKRTVCRTRAEEVRKVIVVVKKATPGSDLTATLDTGQTATATANDRGKAKFGFRGDQVPPCGANAVTVCDQSAEFECGC